MNTPNIESYQFGKIIIDGVAYQKDIIIFPDCVLSNWWREQGHALSLNDLREALDAKPDILIIGTGIFGGMQIPSETLTKLEEYGIVVIALKSKSACELYNQRKDDGRVIAAIHLTC